jgi:hypothetical protein
MEEGLKRLDTMTYDEVLALQEVYNVFDEAAQYSKCWPNPYCSRFGNGRMPDPLSDAIGERIYKRKKFLLMQADPKARRYYENVIPLTPNEIVNGYNLLWVTGEGEPLLSYAKFMLMLAEVSTTPSPSDEDFLKTLHTNCCSDWGRMSLNGEGYGGPYWNAEIGTDEREDAYNLTRDMNFKALMQLPFHRCLILFSIDIGCAIRLECVRYCNSFCVWFERTRAMLQ